MVQTIRDLRLQAGLLILVVCGLLSSLLSIFAHIHHEFPVPGRFELSVAESIAVILLSLTFCAKLTQKAPLAVMSATLFVIFGGYALTADLVIASQSNDLSDIPRNLSQSALAPSLMMLTPAGAILLGFRTNRRRLVALISGFISIFLGLGVSFYHVTGASSASAASVFGVISLGGGLFCVAFGAALVMLASQTAASRSRLPRDATVLGVAAVTATFFLVCLAALGTHSARHANARTILEHHAKAFQDAMESQTNLVERMVNRWAALEFNVPERLQQTEARRYINDIPALNALLLIQPDPASQWRVARSSYELLWLMDQVVTPEALRWLRETRENGINHSWLIPDGARPYTALTVVAPDRAIEGRMVAVFDIQRTLRDSSPQDAHEFQIDLQLGTPPVAHRESDSVTDVFEQLTVAVPHGPEVTLVATAAPLASTSLRGALPPALFLIGLIVSYLLITGRILTRTHEQFTKLLTKSEQRFRSLFSQSPDAVFAFDKHGHYQSLNRIAKATTGIKDSQLGNTHYKDVITDDSMPEEDQTLFDTAFQNALVGHAQSIEVSFIPPGQESKHFECDFLPIVESGEITGVYAIAKDITERFVAEESQRIFKRGLEASDSAVVVVDVRDDKRPVVFVNPAFTEMSGFEPSEVLGISAHELVGFETAPEDSEEIHSAVQSGRPATLTIKSHRKDGSPFWNQISVSPVRDGHHGVTHFVAMMKDISEKKEHENQLAHQATHDALTGLGNRALFEDHLNHDFALAQRNKQHLAVLFIDLDEFKPINDTLGHKTGDELLISVADRLSDCIRPSDTLVRFGGDEFVLLLPDLDVAREAEDVAERILETLSRPHVIGNHELNISASIGISMLRPDLEHPEKLLQQADMAMYKAKQQGRNTYEIFTPDLDSKVSKRVTLRNDLQDAIKKDQLQLHYQPQVNEHGEMCGLEALVRWKHPVKGFISPADFIPIAEQTGQIIELGKWVTTKACEDAVKLRSMGLLKGRMAVNLSPLQFHRPNFMASLRTILEKTSLPPECLELEITEGILMRDTESAIDTLHALSGMGVSTAIDDFGSGFSSFSYLRDLPVDKIKIDRSFVDKVTTNEKDAAVCKGVITLARELDQHVVAEGVETVEQFERLKEFGCKGFQGYNFARPMAFVDLIRWIDT